MAEIFSSIFFEYIGAFLKWLFYSVKNRLMGRKHIPFDTIYSGDKNGEYHDQIFLGMSNILVGFLTCFGILMLIVKFWV